MTGRSLAEASCYMKAQIETSWPRSAKPAGRASRTYSSPSWANRDQRSEVRNRRSDSESGRKKSDTPILLVGATRALGEPFALYRAADSSWRRRDWFHIQRDWITRASPRRAALNRSNATADGNRDAIRYGGAHADVHCLHRRAFLLSRCSLRRAS